LPHAHFGPVNLLNLSTTLLSGIPVIPKSNSVKHQRENIDLFSWQLSEEDMTTLTTAAHPSVAGPDKVTSGDCAVL
jgi:diketogulonate reductase-like aldo/keto reductase